MKTSECDEEIYQSGQFVDECAGNRPTFEDFDPSEPISRVDMLLYEHMHACMAGDKQLAIKCQWSVVKLLLLMSHGQSTVNRGFSLNKEVAREPVRKIIHGHIESVGSLVNYQSESNFLCHLLELDRIIFPN